MPPTHTADLMKHANPGQIYFPCLVDYLGQKINLSGILVPGFGFSCLRLASLRMSFTSASRWPEWLMRSGAVVWSAMAHPLLVQSGHTRMQARGMGKPPSLLIAPVLDELIRRALDPTHKQQDDQNQQDQANPAARVIAPLSAVRPRGQCTHQYQNQDDNQNCSEHIVPPCSSELSLSIGNCCGG
jgi:hypothetical protein